MAAKTKECRSCREQIHRKASICPNCKTRQGWTLGAKFGMGLVILMVFSTCMSRVAREDAQATGQPRPNAATRRVAVTDPACAHLPTEDAQQNCQMRSTKAVVARRRQEEKEGQRKAEQAARERAEIEAKSWRLMTGQDAMTGKEIKQAWVSSRNTLAFDFPYGGEQHATLALRIHPQYGRDVILRIERGQFQCGYDECSVKVRFDDGAVQDFPAGAPDDHSTETLFIQNYDRFVSQARKAREIRVQATFFQQGSQTMEFDALNLGTW